MLRAMRRELETGLRWLLHGHEEGNLGYSQGAAYGLPRQFPPYRVRALRKLDTSHGHASASAPSTLMPRKRCARAHRLHEGMHDHSAPMSLVGTPLWRQLQNCSTVNARAGTSLSQHRSLAIPHRIAAPEMRCLVGNRRLPRPHRGRSRRAEPSQSSVA